MHPTGATAPTAPTRSPYMNTSAWRTLGWLLTAIGVGGLVLLGGAFAAGAISNPLLELGRAISTGLASGGVVLLAVARLAEDRRACETGIRAEMDNWKTALRADLDAREAGVRSDFSALMVTLRRMEETLAKALPEPITGGEREKAWWEGYNHAAKDFSSAGSVVPMPPARGPARNSIGHN